MRPDASKHRHDEDYIYELIKRAGLTVREAADIIGVRSERLQEMVRGKRFIPYTVQFALECLADDVESSRARGSTRGD